MAEAAGSSRFSGRSDLLDSLYSRPVEKDVKRLMAYEITDVTPRCRVQNHFVRHRGLNGQGKLLLALIVFAASLTGCPAPTCDQGDTGGMLEAGQQYRAKARCSGPDGNTGIDPDTSSGDDDAGTAGDGPDLGGAAR
jgi:hypothetical protein